jgi:CheY-like chemotaxis protein/anti-sigma regulatory factor (Ser/Thr protein kinase)
MSLLDSSIPYKRWDRKVFLQTINTFVKELSYFFGNINQSNDFFPGSLKKKMLLQLNENAELLEMNDLEVLLARLVRQVDSTGLEAIANQKTAINTIMDMAMELAAELKNVPESITKDSRISGNDLTGMRILVAEDIKTSRLFLKKILQMKGAEIEMSKDGHECLEKYHTSGPFDLLLMDIFMPGMTGLQATRQLRAEGETVPIVALTALASRDDERDCVEAGCTDYVTKPVDVDLLLQTCCKYSKNECNCCSEKNSSDNVLLITDNKTLQAFLTEILHQRGAIVDTAENSDTALHLFVKKQKEWTLVLIDQQLENKSWQECIKIVLSIRSNLKILLMVNRLDIDDIQDAIKSGCERVLPRPVKYEETLRILDNVINLPQETELEKTQHFSSTHLPSSKGIIRTGCDDLCDQIAVFQKSFFEKGGDRTYCRQFNEHGRSGIILADVAGHDNKSAVAASWLTGILEGMWRYNQDPEKLLKKLAAHYETSMDRDLDTRFICLLVLMYDKIRNILFYANAGIPPAYLVDTENPKNSRLLEWTGTPIGLFPGQEQFEWGQFEFLPGNRLFLATDGIFESISTEVTTQLYEYFVTESLTETVEKISDFYLRSIPPDDDLTIAVFAAADSPVPPGGSRFSILSTYEFIDHVMKDIDIILEQYDGRIDAYLVSLAVREVILNAVEHGNKKNDTKYVDIDIIPGENTLTVLVSDEGSGFSYHQSKKEKFGFGNTPIQGRGLKALTQIVSGFETMGGSVKLTFELKDNQA